jgi:hypothetical protein
VHGPPVDESTKRNYVKQAQQARVAVLQAKEYFDAARASTLYTAANHLYYGMASLSVLQMLILGDGSKSLDRLRTNPNNAHHGLRFTTGATARSAAVGLTLLENSRAEVVQNGHFINWYSTLPRRIDINSVFHLSLPDGGTAMNFQPSGGYDTASSSAMVGRKRSTLQLLCLIPDLFRDLQRYGATVVSARITHEIRIPPQRPPRHIWLVHQVLQPERFPELLAKFSVPPRFEPDVSFKAQPNGMVWAIEVIAHPLDGLEIRWPTSRETMDHQSIAYAEEIDTHEFVDGFVVAYQLSMLSRYFPDLWVACVESHCKAAKLIEQAVSLLIKKSPILALSMLTPGGITISTHREPWK